MGQAGKVLVTQGGSEIRIRYPLAFAAGGCIQSSHHLRQPLLERRCILGIGKVFTVKWHVDHDDPHAAGGFLADSARVEADLKQAFAAEITAMFEEAPLSGSER